MRVFVPTALILLALATPVLAQVPTPTPATGPTIEVSNWRLRRDLSFIIAAGQTGNRLADAALDRLFGVPEGRGWKQFAERFARLYLVNLPIVAVLDTSAHEVGHIVRSNEGGIDTMSINFSNWPWPVPQVGDKGIAKSYSPGVPANLSGIAGGQEADDLRAKMVEDEIHRRGAASDFDWAQLAYAKWSDVIYNWAGARAGWFRDWDSYFAAPPADPKEFAFEFAYRRTLRNRLPGVEMPDVAAVATTIRRGNWLNLADVSLWTSASRGFQYVVTGEQEANDLTIPAGPVRIAPAAHFAMTPIGLSYSAGSYVITANRLWHAEAGWIDEPLDGRSWRTSADVRTRETSGAGWDARVDLWRRAGQSPGLRVEGGAETNWIVRGHRVTAHVALGYKTSGYVSGAPLTRSVLVAVSGRIGF